MLDKILGFIAEKLSLIGTNYSASANVNITSTDISTMAHGAHVTLTAGTYLLIAGAAFPTVSGSRNLNVRIGTTSEEWNYQRISTLDGSWAKLEATEYRTITAETTVYCSVSSTKTVNAVQTGIKAIRLK